MAKRYTDAKKWRNEWFRTLPLKAKLAWIYICDECEYHGVWKSDFGLASFQLGFTLSLTDLKIWFGEKVHVFNGNCVLIVPFFEFQYGDSKDTWSAKANARKKLETLGFSVIENKVEILPIEDSGVTVEDCAPQVLLKVKVKVKGKVNNKNIGHEKFKFEISLAEYLKLSGVTKGSKAFARFQEQILSDEDFEKLMAAISNYREFLAHTSNAWRKPKTTFETFLGTKSSGYFWHDYIEHINIKTDEEIPLNPDYFDPEVLV